jgi:hypothetical protein
MMLEIRITTFPLIMGAAALGLYASKPPLSSFKPFFKTWLQERLRLGDSTAECVQSSAVAEN